MLLIDPPPQLSWSALSPIYRSNPTVIIMKITITNRPMKPHYNDHLPPDHHLIISTVAFIIIIISNTNITSASSETSPPVKPSSPHSSSSSSSSSLSSKPQQSLPQFSLLYSLVFLFYTLNFKCKK